MLEEDADLPPLKLKFNSEAYSLIFVLLHEAVIWFGQSPKISNR